MNRAVRQVVVMRRATASASYGANVWPQPTFAASTGLEFDSNDPPVIAGNTLAFQDGQTSAPVYCRTSATVPAGTYRYDITVVDPGIGGTAFVYFISASTGTLFMVGASGFGTIVIPGGTARKIGFYDPTDRGTTTISAFTFRPVL